MRNIFEHYLLGEQLYEQMLQPICAKHGLSFVELSVVMFLANNPMLDTASDISKCRGLAKSHVSVSVRALEERGLLTRDYRDGNRRSVHLQLSAAAAPLVADGREAQMRFGALLFEGITPQEREVVSEVFDRIDANIRKHTEGGHEK